MALETSGDRAGSNGVPRCERRLRVSINQSVIPISPDCAIPGPSLSSMTSQWKALRVTFEPVEWSVDRVELLRSMGFGGGKGGEIELL